jgi:hypothetical protein
MSATPLLGQSTTDGAVGGTVFDSTGAVIANAHVTIHNNGTNAEQTATTDDSGYYRVIHLQPGSYTVSVSRQGFGAFKAEQVIVDVGSLTEISAHLKPAGAGETVDVTAEAPQINYVTPDFAPSLNQTAISNLPINGGRWSNFAMLTPGVTSDVNNFGLLSFRGISSLLNNNTVDGGDNNQAFFSEERGRTRIGYSTPKAAVDEFQVNTSNYSSEYGRSAGGVVNTVTKSGTNTIHGEGYFYDRDNDWGAANRFTQIAVQSTPGGPFTLVNFKPKNWRKMAGFGVGGPLIKDKLFLFVAYDWYKQNFPGTAVASNPNVFFAAPSASTITTLATRLGVTTTQATSIYNTDLAALNSMLGVVPRTGEQNILFPKIDWQIGPKHHASFSVNRMRWSSPAGIQTQATNTLGIASFGNDYVKDTWGVAKLVSSITPSIVNELRYQYGRDFEYEFAQPPTPYELNNLVNTPSFTNPLGLPPNVSITNGFSFGVPTFLQRPAFPDETRHQVADTVNWSHGKHAVKFGVDFGHVIDTSKNLRLQFGSYSYSSLLNYFSDLNKPKTCTGGTPCYSSFTQAFGPLGFQFNTNDIAFFAQDDWRFTSRLSFSLGFRYEYEMLPSPFNNLVNPLIPQTGNLPSDKNNFGPRVGFAYDMFGNGKTVVRGGYGIYYGRIINSTIFTALTNTGMTGGQNSFFFLPSSAGAPVFPQILASAPPPSGTARPNVTFFDSHFQNPQIHQMDLTVERDLGWGTVFSVSYLGSLGRELPNFIDTNICTSASQPGCAAAAPTTTTFSVLPGGPLTAATLTEPLFTSRPVDLTRTIVGSNFGAMTDIVSGTNSSYHAFVMQVNHRMNHNVQFSANYTWAHAIDFGQNQTTFADTNDFLLPAGVPNTIKFEKGNSIYDIPNRFVVNAVATSPWKEKGWLAWVANDWQFSPIYQIQSGLPYTLSVAGSTPGGAAGGINGSGGFPNRIDVLGVNTFRRPKTWAADLRLAKYLTFQEKYKLELLADFFNIANKQNVTGVNNTGYLIGTSAGVCGTATPPCLSPFSTFGTTTNVNNSNFNPTPRQIQLGLRVQF